jgi:signal transduction histidine kinase
MRWFRNRHLLSLVGMVAAALLLVAAFILGLVSFATMREVIADEFNAQQLGLARNLATLIRQDLDFLKRELLVLSQSPFVDPMQPAAWRNRMKVALQSVEGGELLEVRYIDASGTTMHALPASGSERVEAVDLRSTAAFQWAARPENRGKVLISDERQSLDRRRNALTLLMVTPHVAAPPAGAAAGSPSDFEGALLFVVDASAVARRFTGDARSGTTGYAWVIDDTGTFLAHPMTDFIGQSAFTARHEKDPRLAFEGINLIMRDHMLRGQEGVGEYESGWHRQMVGPVRKLIGYCPIHVDPDPATPPWSVAVVAPTSEVQGMVRTLFLRQLFVQSAIALAILAGSVSLLRMERYWANVQKAKERQIDLNSRLAALGTLAAGVAHEVNNPIAIVLGFTDLLLEKTPPDAEAYSQLKIIEKQATACKRIVENLGRFARGPAQGDETVDINAELERVLTIVRNTLLTEKIRCVADLEDDLPVVRADPHGIQQVLLNLVSNARAAMTSGGTLTLRTRRTGSSVEVEVSDTGHGIAARDVRRIFDPFFTTKPPGEGVGLGLSISHGIIHKAGGTITVESRHENEVGRERCGTTFRVLLPGVAEPAEHPAVAFAP